jgi:hypothetical protein
MKLVAFSVAAAAFAAVGTLHADAHTSHYSCEIQGQSFVLSDKDFDAMKAGPSEKGVTRRQFASLPQHSDERARICLTRLLVRALEAATVKCADMTGKFGDYGSGYMSDAETDRLALFQKRCP